VTAPDARRGTSSEGDVEGSPQKAVVSGQVVTGMQATVDVMVTKPNTVQLASIRVITDDLPGLVRFYEVLTGATPQYLTEDFVELVTPSATFALSTPQRVAFITDNTPRAAANSTAIVEFVVEDVESLLAIMKTELGDDLDVVQPPTMMPWGNLSVLIRDPEGSLINLYTPVTPQALQLQENRTPKMLPPSS
jgi:predicted enzyme related to lactoylglutathione lyase